MASDRKNAETAQKLLWTGIEQPRRGPRHRLTVERIAEAGLTVAENSGATALSMRAVAEELGVGVASLYTYVPDKAALLALMSDIMVSQLPLPHTLPGNWRAQTESWARDELAAFRAYPWLAGFDDSRAIGPHAFAWMDSAIRVFEGTGLSPQEALSVVEAVSGYIRGHTGPVIAEDQAREWTSPSGQRWSSHHKAFHASEGPEPGCFPFVESVTSPPTAEETFEAGLSWLLDGVEAQIQAAQKS